MKSTNNGFTLIELMIVIAIIGVLASVAVPQYGQYAKRVKFTHVISKAIPLKMAVGTCAQDNNALDQCDNDYGDIGPEITSIGYVASLTVENGTITAVGTSEINDAVYKLVPDYNSTNSTLSWDLDNSTANACINYKFCK